MPAFRIIALTAATFTPITASIFARRVVITEDGSVASSGLQARFARDNYTQVYDYPPQNQPIVIGDPVSAGLGGGMYLGMPTQTGLNARTADTYVQLQAMGGGATTVRVEEYE